MGTDPVLQVNLEPEESPTPERYRGVFPFTPQQPPGQNSDASENEDSGISPFDWLTEVAIPLSIFGLLSCLLYYLIDLRAALGGEFSSMLRWVSFWFLIAAIGITRIRTKYGNATIATPYIVGLAVTTGLAIYHFTFSAGALAESLSAWGALSSLVFNYSLIGLIWWLAHLLTRNCTLEENFQQALNSGLFGEANSPATGRSAHPGRWLLWVSGIAVLIFGLGARIIGDNGFFTRHAFVCMAGFVAFTLLLMALTNLSALRMDTRRRNISLSNTLTPGWIGASIILVVLISLLASLLPRPSALPGKSIEYGPRAAWMRDYDNNKSSGKGPAAGLGVAPPDGSTVPGRDAQTQGEGAPATTGAIGASGADGENTGGQGDQSTGSADQGGEGKSGATQTDEAAGSAASGQTGGQGGSDSSQQTASTEEAEASSSQTEKPDASAEFSWPWLWLILLLILAILTYLAIRYRRLLPAWLRALTTPLYALWTAMLAFWQRFLQLLNRSRQTDNPFIDLPVDPFADIWAQRELLASMTPAQIVRHVYRAFNAYCALRGHARPEYQTELEFLRTLPPQIGLADDDPRVLTNTYVLATYSPEGTGAAQVDIARDVWSRLRPAIEQALAIAKHQPENPVVLSRVAR